VTVGFKAIVVHVQNFFFTHAPSITPSTSKKENGAETTKAENL
jgi:hypothetical protein